MKHIYSFLIIAALLLIGALQAAPVAAAGISVDPTYGGFDDTYAIHANGFQNNELVDTWVGLPNLTTVDTGTLQADGSGAVEWSFDPTPNTGGGEYIAVAHGRVSGEVFVKFNVVAPPADNPTPAPSAPQPQPIAPLSERTAQFNATGYQGGELVNTWFQAPNGVITGYNNFTADAWGNLTFPFVMSNGNLYGGWQVVGKGTRSGNNQFITFSWFGTVTDVRASKPIVNAAPYFDFMQGGFASNEKVSIWIGFPNGGAQALADVTANSNGTVSYRVNIQPGWQFGGYIVAAFGWKSHVTKWQRFSYFDAEVNRLYP